jgi:ribosomal protein S12 methylthiotransferase accessory factor
MTCEDQGPLVTSAEHLERAFAARRGAVGTELPVAVVSALGTRSFLGRPADPVAASASVHLSADAVIIGPWSGGPLDQPCGQCVGMRWQHLRSRSEREALEYPPDPAAAGSWPQLTPFVVDAAWSLYVEVFASGRRPSASAFAAEWQRPADLGLAQVSRLDLETLSVLTVPILRDPLCPSCHPGGPAVAPVPLELLSRPKSTPTSFRTRHLDEYALPTASLANPVSGVLGSGTWVNVTSPTTAPVSGSAFERGYAGLNNVTWSGQSNSYDTSRRLAFMEGLERYAGTHRRDHREPLVASYSSLGDRALDPRSCGSYSPETYRDDPFVDPFDPDREIPWVWGHSLRDDRVVLVPARLVYYSAGLAADNFVFECSNGCATGSSIEEAALFGLLELIERDSFLLAWYGGAHLPELDLSTCSLPVVHAMINRADLLGYDVHAFDNRVDLDVPVVTALAVRRDGGPGTYSFAAGASLDVDAAVEGALSEVLTYIPHLSGQVKEGWDELSQMVHDFGRVTHLTDHARLFGLPEMAPHVRRYLEPLRVQGLVESYGVDGSAPRSMDLLDDLAHVRDQVVKAGHDVIVVDQTAPEQAAIGLRNVCMLAPGLLPIDFGWPRQRALRMPRLRTAYRTAGWRDTDLSEDEIIRVPHPFP